MIEANSPPLPGIAHINSQGGDSHPFISGIPKHLLGNPKVALHPKKEYPAKDKEPINILRAHFGITEI
jgi:hypothetical protein